MISDRHRTPEFFRRAIEQALREFVERELDAAIKNAVENAQKRKGEVVTGIMVDIMRMTDFQILQDRIVITIRDDDKE